MPTRLLDWSNNPLVALYFALLESPNKEEVDGKLFFLDAYKMAEAQDGVDINQEPFKGIATSHNPTLKNAISVIAHWKKSDCFPNFIIPVRPDHLDRRMGLQRSCFTFHVPGHPEIG